ncbi:MAG TPA: heme ABC exporter ATP-binding protein CcmA [Rhizomicrobium sp.]|nr:heme ABC exporter ATP-binding protein CcmA [Rhizomicrobium sp.]
MIPSLSLDVRALTGIRGQRVLFRDLGFRVGAGEVLSLEGPNGAGKTSLLRMIAGFLAPAAGRIALVADGKDVDDAEERGKRIAWLGHQDAARPQLTVSETLRFFARLYGGAADHGAALAAVGLAPLANLPCQYLSAGQKKRLALARLTLLNRPVWLLDEPLSSLDAEGRTHANALISGHAAQGGIAVAATHEPIAASHRRLVLGDAA